MQLLVGFVGKICYISVIKILFDYISIRKFNRAKISITCVVKMTLLQIGPSILQRFEIKAKIVFL